jgi:hypothetical protein
VHLAASLLRDRHGVIDIELPVSGSLDDPDFKVWPAVWKAFGQLIAKAATAPFKLIGQAFGGGDDLSRLEFPAGLATLDASTRGKVGALGKALRERPELSFEIEGRADPTRDRDGLRRDLLERKLRTQKKLEVTGQGSSVASSNASWDDVPLAAAERPRLLQKTYEAETFSKPRNIVGLPKRLSAEQTEKLMLEHIVVRGEDLLGLAQRRAVVTRDALARVAPRGAARAFLVAPVMARGGGVELRLKKR